MKPQRSWLERPVLPSIGERIPSRQHHRSAAALGAADLIRSTGLLADGPVRWGAPLPSRKGGVYVVELVLAARRGAAGADPCRQVAGAAAGPAPRRRATHLARPRGADRLALVAGARPCCSPARPSARSAGGPRPSYAHVAGDRQPHPDGQWLHLLRSIEAPRRAPVVGRDRRRRRSTSTRSSMPSGPPPAPAGPTGPAGALALPWANTRRPTGERQAHGITGSVVPEPPRAPEPPRRVVELPPGDAEGARPEDRGSGTTRRAPSSASTPIVTTPRTPLKGARMPAATGPSRRGEPEQDAPRPHASAGTPRPCRSSCRRPPSTGYAPSSTSSRASSDPRWSPASSPRASTATSRRTPSTTPPGRSSRSSRAGCRRSRTGSVEPSSSTSRRRRPARSSLGSIVRVETGGDELTYTIVGSVDANLAAGRISSASPVGAALLGAVAGQDVDIQTPARVGALPGAVGRLTGRAPVPGRATNAATRSSTSSSTGLSVCPSRGIGHQLGVREQPDGDAEQLDPGERVGLAGEQQDRAVDRGPVGDPRLGALRGAGRVHRVAEEHEAGVARRPPRRRGSPRDRRTSGRPRPSPGRREPRRARRGRRPPPCASADRPRRRRRRAAGGPRRTAPCSPRCRSRRGRDARRGPLATIVRARGGGAG